MIDEASFEKVEKRLHNVGVSMTEMQNGVSVLRNPIEILEDLAEVYNALPDNSIEKAGIITDLGGKHRGNQLAALLSSWNKYEKILGDFQNAEGSAAQEAEKTANSWQGSLNRLSNTWSDFVSNFVDSSTIIGALNFFDGMLSGLDKLTEFSTVLGTIGATVGGLASIRGVG